MSVAVIVLGAAAGCGDRERSDGAPVPGESQVVWERGEVEIQSASETIIVPVEIAETDEQRAYGLMNRDALPRDEGMLFMYDSDQPAEGSFWMFNTRIPLDIAFIGDDDRIVSIRQMEPCTSPYPQWCPSYAAGAEYRAALEMNQGWFERRGVTVGDVVLLNR